MNKRYYEHTLPIIRGSLSNTYVAIPQLRCLLATFETKYIDIQSVPLER